MSFNERLAADVQMDLVAEHHDFMVMLGDCGLSEAQVHTLSDKVTNALNRGFSYGKILTEFDRIPHQVGIHHPKLSPLDRQNLYVKVIEMLDNLENTVIPDNSASGD